MCILYTFIHTVSLKLNTIHLFWQLHFQCMMKYVTLCHTTDGLHVWVVVYLTILSVAQIMSHRMPGRSVDNEWTKRRLSNVICMAVSETRFETRTVLIRSSNDMLSVWCKVRFSSPVNSNQIAHFVIRHCANWANTSYINQQFKTGVTFSIILLWEL
jgi:hypothetical protein